MKPRAQLKHALLRVILPSLSKVRSLKRNHGSQGKCSLYEAYMMMSGSTNAIVDRDSILDIAEDNEVADPEGFLKFCLEKELIIVEGEGLSSNPVIEDQEAYAATLERRSEDAERKRLGRSGERPPDIPRTVRRTSPGFPDSESVIDHVSDLDLKNNGLVRLAEFVYVAEPQLEVLKMNYRREGLSDDDFNRAVEFYDRELTNHPEKRRFGCHYKDLCLWPKTAIKEEKARLERAKPKINDSQRHNPAVSKLLAIEERDREQGRS